MLFCNRFSVKLILNPASIYPYCTDTPPIRRVRQPNSDWPFSMAKRKAVFADLFRFTLNFVMISSFSYFIVPIRHRSREKSGAKPAEKWETEPNAYLILRRISIFSNSMKEQRRVSFAFFRRIASSPAQPFGASTSGTAARRQFQMDCV